MGKMDNVLKWIGIARLILPTALIAAGVPAEAVHGITNTVVDAETALGPGTGAEKLAAVVKGVTDGMEAKGVSPTTIAATKATLEHGVSSAVQLVNDVHDLKAAHEAPPGTVTETTTVTKTTSPADPASGD
jgi:biotin synthase-like enzyme